MGKQSCRGYSVIGGQVVITLHAGEITGPGVIHADHFHKVMVT